MHMRSLRCALVLAPVLAAAASAQNASLRLEGTVTEVIGPLPVEFQDAAVGDAVRMHVGFHAQPGNLLSWSFTPILPTVTALEIGGSRYVFPEGTNLPGINIGPDAHFLKDQAYCEWALPLPTAGYNTYFSVVQSFSGWGQGDFAQLASLGTQSALDVYGPDEVVIRSGLTRVLQAEVHTFVFHEDAILEVCDSLPNTTGQRASLSTSSVGGGFGSGLHLECTQGPPGEFGFFFIGQGIGPELTVFEGIHCLSQPTGRYNSIIAANQGKPELNSLGQFDANGVLQNLSGTSNVGSGFDVPLFLPYAPAGQLIAPGDSWTFQLWFRDRDDQGMPSANFSNAIEVVFD